MTLQVRLRPEQEAAVEAVVRSFDEGKEVVVLDAPTGAGKSILHAEIANRLGVRCFITTPQISLVNQMLNDPRFHALSPEAEIIVGRRNYPCLREPTITADRATCYELGADGKILKNDFDSKVVCQHKQWIPKFDIEPDCQYYHHKMLGELSPVTVTSLAYFLVGTMPVDLPDTSQKTLPAPDGEDAPAGEPAREPDNGPTKAVPGWDCGRLSGRDVLMIDEAHGLAETVIAHLTTSFWRTRYRAGDWTGLYQAWTERPAFQSLKQGAHWDLDTLKTELDQLVDVLDTTAAAAKIDDSLLVANDEAQVAQDVDKLTSAVDDLDKDIPWIARARTNRLGDVFELQPVIAARHLQRTLWTKARRFILSSGTWIDPKAKLEELGITTKPTRLVTMRSTFPPENGPTFLFPVTRFTYETRDKALPMIAEQLWKTMRVETGRGVVHAQSYANARELYLSCPADLVDRLILHTQDSDRDQLIRDFQNDAPAGAVLLSPSVTEGLDLPGERGEWTAFLKTPFPSLADERVKKRTQMRNGWHWYEQQAIEKTIQGRGRVIRSATCVARCYIYDEAQIALLKKWWRQLPDWFQASIRVGESRKVEQLQRIEMAVQPPRKEFQGTDFSKLGSAVDG